MLHSFFIPIVEVFELDGKNRTLDTIETEVAANYFVEVSRILAMVAKDSDFLRKVFSVCRYQTAIAEASEVLGWVK